MKRKSIYAVSFVMLISILIGVLGIFGTVNKVNTTANPFKNAYGSLPILEDAAKSNLKKVYVGGNVIGISMGVKGVIVNGKIPVVTTNGVVDPCAKQDIRKGDIIKKINDVPITSVADIKNIIKAAEEYKLEIMRNGVTQNITVEAVQDEVSKSYKLGIWLKESIDGLGTVTYIDKENHRFGALGHVISDSESGICYNDVNGKIYNATLYGVVKGEKGKAGEILGGFDKSRWVGKLDKNTDYGMFGNWQGEYTGDLVEVATRDMVKPGKAEIISAVTGKLEKYSIEIVKANKQKKEEIKSMMIRITDKKLLSTTNGILQGMSGSPIIQNGRLVGAVTHVFISDPTKGYGVYIDWMINK